MNRWLERRESGNKDAFKVGPVLAPASVIRFCVCGEALRKRRPCPGEPGDWVHLLDTPDTEKEKVALRSGMVARTAVYFVGNLSDILGIAPDRIVVSGAGFAVRAPS